MGELTIKQYLGNAPGFYSRQVAPRYMIKDQMLFNFLTLFRDKPRHFGVKVWKKSEYLYRVWVKVPSSKYDMTYDIVADITFKEGRSYFDYGEIKLYTNSPAWVYTYAYVFNQDGLIPDDLLKYVSVKAIEEAPKKTNPSQNTGFEKITYFAFLFLTKALLIKSKYDLANFIAADKEDWDDVKNFQTDEKMAEYNELKREHKDTTDKKAEAKKANAPLVAANDMKRYMSNGVRVAKPARSSTAKTRVARKPRTGKK